MYFSVLLLPANWQLDAEARAGSGLISWVIGQMPACLLIEGHILSDCHSFCDVSS